MGCCLYASSILPFPFNVAVAGVSVAYIIEAGIEAYQNHIALQNVAYIAIDAAAGTSETVFINDSDGSIIFKGNYANASVEEENTNVIASGIIKGYRLLNHSFQTFSKFTSFKIPSLSAKIIKTKTIETFNNLQVKVIAGSNAIAASLSGTPNNIKLKLTNIPKNFDNYITLELNYDDHLQKEISSTLRVKAKNFDSLKVYKEFMIGTWYMESFIHDGKGGILKGAPNYTGDRDVSFNVDGSLSYVAISDGSKVTGTYTVYKSGNQYYVNTSFLGCPHNFITDLTVMKYKVSGCGGFAYWNYLKR